MATLKIYHNENGNEPFTKWLEGIGDRRTDARIRQHLRKIVEYGDLEDRKTLGDNKSLQGTDSMSEFRIDDGPGYRIYWGRIGKNTLLLLRGGIRKTQRKDIKSAKADWKEHKRRGLKPSNYSDFPS